MIPEYAGCSINIVQVSQPSGIGNADTTRISITPSETERRDKSKVRNSTPRAEGLKHLATSQSADRSACRLSIHSPSPSQVVERRSGSPFSLRVAVEDEPDRQLGPAQVGHAGIDEGVQHLEAKPRLTSRSSSPTGLCRGVSSHRTGNSIRMPKTPNSFRISQPAESSFCLDIRPDSTCKPVTALKSLL